MGLDQRDPIRDVLLDLADKLGSTWKHVGRRLGLHEAAIENLEADFSCQQERGVQMLLQWRQGTGTQDLVTKLDEGLRKAKRTDLAEIFVPRCQEIIAAPRMPNFPSVDVSNPKEHEMVSILKNRYIKQNKVPMIPWAGKNGKIVTVDLQKIYTNLELLVDIESPDLPIHFPLKLEQLFDDVRAPDGNDTEGADGEERLAVSSTRVVARGRTGSGKTTFLLKLSSDWADGKRGPLKGAAAVFLLQLKRLDHESNLGDAIVDNLLHGGSFTPPFVESFVENNQKSVAVLLDGYDEFKGKGLNKKKCGNIVKMLRREYLPDVRILVTTRPGRVEDFMTLEDHITDEYRHLEITGFSSSDIDAYITKVFKSRKDLGVKLLNYLEENHLKTELASLPLMCCAFCQLTKLTDGKDFKDMNTISTLFDKLIKCLLEYHPRSKEQRSHAISLNGTTKEDSDVVEARVCDPHETNCSESESTIADIARQGETGLDLVVELGKVALAGFFRSQEEELVFNKNDFKDCIPGAEEIITRGCKVGVLVRDGELEYRPTQYEDLEINNHGDEDYAHSITFVLKIFQEKFAGLYLANLSTGSKEEQRLFMTYVQGITTIQRAIDLGNVLMFACGANIVAARIIIDHVVHLLQPEAANISLFMNGKLHFSECHRVQKLVEFCLQLNYECQSRGQLNEVLKQLMSDCSRIRLVGISSYVTKSLGYLLQHSKDLPVRSLALIRLHLNSSSEFREFLNTFPGLEDSVTVSMQKKRRQKKKMREEPLTEEKRVEKLREGVSKGRALPKYLLQRPDDTFFAVLPLWEQVSRMQMSDWNFGPVVEGLKCCAVEELILNGVKAEPEDWKSLFEMIADPNFSSLQRLTLSMTEIRDELLAQLVPGLMSQSNLTYLKLSGNEVGPEFLDAFDNCLPMECLETLILDKTDMDSECIEQLGDILKLFPSLRQLDIRRNTGSDDTSIGSILDNLHHCPHLDKLLISLHEVKEKGLYHFQCSVDILSKLKELHLVHTPLPEEVIACVAAVLPMMSNLQDLRISGTPPDKAKSQPEASGVLSREVADGFSEAIVRTPSIKFLSILYTSFDAQSFITLLQKCSMVYQDENHKLDTLRFSLSCIPPDDEVRRHIRSAEKTFLRIWV